VNASRRSRSSRVAACRSPSDARAFVVSNPRAENTGAAAPNGSCKMHKLIQGLHHFQNHIFGNHRALFERLAGGQCPEVLFITCSDSRIVPNLITQAAPGDLFCLRNAGAIVPAYGPVACGEVATIEFAVQGLKVRDIVICGHTGCGAMGALFNRGVRDQMPAVDAWLGHAEATRRLVCDHYRDLDGDALLNVAAQENVLVQLENLRTHPAVHAAIAVGRLNLHGWVYKIETGEVHGYQPDTCTFAPLVDTPTHAAVGE
jgi:carbonic anhydrase